jgi:hypothetical protein
VKELCAYRIVLGEDESDVFPEESDDSLFDTDEEDSDKDSDTGNVSESESDREESDLMQPFVPHEVARPRFVFLGVNGVNVDFHNETSVLGHFQKFTDEDMWQLFAEQTNIYTPTVCSTS